MAKYNSDKLPMENFKNILRSIVNADGGIDEKIEYINALADELIEQNGIDLYLDKSVQDNIDIMKVYYDMMMMRALLETEKNLQEKEFIKVTVSEFYEPNGEYKGSHSINIGFQISEREHGAPIIIYMDWVDEKHLDEKARYVYDKVKGMDNRTVFKKFIMED